MLATQAGNFWASESELAVPAPHYLAFLPQRKRERVLKIRPGFADISSCFFG